MNKKKKTDSVSAPTLYERLNALYETSQELAVSIHSIMVDAQLLELLVEDRHGIDMLVFQARTLRGVNGDMDCLCLKGCPPNFLMGKGQRHYLQLDDAGHSMLMRAPLLNEVRGFVLAAPAAYDAVEKYVLDTEKAANTAYNKVMCL
jgi:hypothetical protein